MPELWNQVYSEVEDYLGMIDSIDKLNAIIYLYVNTYLQDDILLKVDRASMANSLEVRAPLLDYKLVEFINTIPFSLKLKNLTTKYIFKKAMDGLLPQKNIYRSKKGFGIPVARWFRKDLKPLVQEVFAEETIRSQNFFDFSYINRLLNEHFDGKKDNRKLLWTLFMFQQWLQQYGS